MFAAKLDACSSQPIGAIPGNLPRDHEGHQHYLATCTAPTGDKLSIGAINYTTKGYFAFHGIGVVSALGVSHTSPHCQLIRFRRPPSSSDTELRRPAAVRPLGAMAAVLDQACLVARPACAPRTGTCQRTEPATPRDVLSYSSSSPRLPIQPRLQKKTSIAPAVSSIAPSSAGYAQRRWSSGMLSKFMP